MITQEQAHKFAAEQQTIADNIYKEHYQMWLLDILFNAAIGDALVFKGGTALRLAYAFTRFSEDLDFSLTDDIGFADFSRSVDKAASVIPGASVKDIHDKRHTLYARLVINTAFRADPVGIKIEVNKNTGDFERTVRLIKSPCSNLEVIGHVYTLESVLKDKIRIIENQERREPRDLYDAWCICQKLNRDFVVKDEYKYERKALMDRLNPFLPKNHRKVIELFEK